MSKKSYEELKAKLDHLKTVKRPAISKAIQEAREHGDLKENSAYHEAKKDQSLNEARIVEMERMIGMAVVFEAKLLPKSHVVMGSTVKLKNIKTKELAEYTVVSELEADIFENKISSTSPLGKTLLNRKKNETIQFESPAGTMKYKILLIS